MKTIPALITLLLVCENLISQDIRFQKPNYQGIEKVVKDDTSKYYYSKLYDRYINNDTSLNLQDYRLLYYGYLFNENYSPYGVSVFTDSLTIFFQKDSLAPDDFMKIASYEREILKINPFNIRDLNALAFSCFNMGEIDLANLIRLKIHMIVETILSTGDGRTNETAWHVILVGHEYDLLNVLGFSFGGTQVLTSEGCDKLSVEKNDYDIEEFYFDVNMILNAEKNLFK